MEFTKEQLFFSSATGVPKHSKKDYEYLNNAKVGDIFKSAISENKKAQVDTDFEDQFKNMIKIE